MNSIGHIFITHTSNSKGSFICVVMKASSGNTQGRQELWRAIVETSGDYLLPESTIRYREIHIVKQSEK